MESSDDPVVNPDPPEQEADTVEVTQKYHSQRVVALGGSAGSIPAFREFFSKLPSDTGASYVVVMHLSPEHESRLAQVLQQHTSMAVTQVNDAVEMEKNAVYVIPPAHNLQITDGSLRLTSTDRGRGKRVSVDLLFRTLADTHGPNAVAIVFSGGDSDGSIGIKRIKETGGLTMAQDPSEAEHEGMPRAAVATGMVDWVMPAGEMAGRLVEYWQNARRLRLPEANDTAESTRLEEGESKPEAALRGILGYLRTRTGRDFSYYKRATILRRIARRMQVNGQQDTTEYLDFLRAHPGEAEALLQDLLISVTNFFRDPKSFETLEQILPSLFAGKGHGDSVRVWVPACATGEEAYSIAILLCEYAAKMDDPPALQVFATDLDEQAIRMGRAGYYTEMIAADVSEERLRRFFARGQGGYLVRREVREIVLFAMHDLLKDAAFSRCDLITCRNLLIYLNRDAQRRAMEIFHFALVPEGKLFLGSSELLESGNGLFTVEDKEHRIYIRRAVTRVNLPVPVGPGTMAAMDLRNPDGALPNPAQAEGVQTRALSPLVTPLLRSQIHYRLLEALGPPSVVVNDEYDIVHLSEHAGRFLEFSGGDPTVNLLRVVEPGLRIPLRTALFRAAQSGDPVEADGGTLTLEGRKQRVGLRVVPRREGKALYLLVLFEPRAPDASPPAPAPSPEPVMRHLEQELEQVKLNLRETVEQYEATTEELRASNEELLAMNEELRSATEELETSREELQSINEELSAVNVELKSKVDEIGRSNNDLHNLMASTAIATVFLDRNLLISRYTPAAVALFNLIPTDLGRPLSDLNPQLDYPDLAGDAARVLENLGLIEREARHPDGRWFYIRMLPYRTTDDRIGGVVLTLTDVTSRKEAEKAARVKDEMLRADFEAMQRLLAVSERFVHGEDLSQLLEAIGRAAVALMEASQLTVHLRDPETGELAIVASEGLSEKTLSHLASGPKAVKFWSDLLERGQTAVIEDTAAEAPFDGGEDQKVLEEAGLRSLVAVPLRTREGEALGVLTCYFGEHKRLGERRMRFLDLMARQAADAIERTRAVEGLAKSEERLRVAVRAGRMGTWDWDIQSGAITWSEEHNRMVGLPEEQQTGTVEEFMERVHPDDRARVEKRIEVALEKREKYAMEFRVVLADGTHRWIAATGHALCDEENRPSRMIGVIQDITERKNAAEALQAREAWLRLMVENAREYGIFAMDRERRVTYWNSGAERLLGYEENEICGQPIDRIFTPEDCENGVPGQEIATARREGRASDERWHRRKDGSRFWASGSLMAMRDTSGETVGFVKILRDQTAVREAREALEKSRAELWEALQETERARADSERASKAKDMFLAMLSHELRTPLTPVLMGVRTIERQPELPNLTREALGMIRRNIETESRLIDDLLDVTRISRGKLEIVREPINLHEAVRHAMEISESDIQGRKHRVEMDLKAEKCELQADRLRIEQVFWNLLKNASKFMKQSGVIAVRSWNDEGTISVSVEDHGVGVAAESLENIFEAFTQENVQMAKEFGGLGLGLAIAKATVEAHGGSLEANSDGRGLGATFTVTLPLDPPSAEGGTEHNQGPP